MKRLWNGGFYEQSACRQVCADCACAQAQSLNHEPILGVDVMIQGWVKDRKK